MLSDRDRGREIVRKKYDVNLLNLTEAMKRRSLGRNVCWCTQFELLTLLAHAQTHRDIELGHPELSWLLSKWHISVTVAVVTGNRNDLSHVCTAGISMTPGGDRNRMGCLWLFRLDLNHPCGHEYHLFRCIFPPHCIVFQKINHKVSNNRQWQVLF